MKIKNRRGYGKCSGSVESRRRKVASPVVTEEPLHHVEVLALRRFSFAALVTIAETHSRLRGEAAGVEKCFGRARRGEALARVLLYRKVSVAVLCKRPTGAAQRVLPWRESSESLPLVPRWGLAEMLHPRRLQSGLPEVFLVVCKKLRPVVVKFEAHCCHVLAVCGRGGWAGRCGLPALLPIVPCHGSPGRKAVQEGPTETREGPVAWRLERVQNGARWSRERGGLHGVVSRELWPHSAEP